MVGTAISFTLFADFVYRDTPGWRQCLIFVGVVCVAYSYNYFVRGNFRLPSDATSLVWTAAILLLGWNFGRELVVKAGRRFSKPPLEDSRGPIIWRGFDEDVTGRSKPSPFMSRKLGS